MRAVILPAADERLSEVLGFMTAGLPEGFFALAPQMELVLEELLVNIGHYAYGGAGGEVELSRRLVKFDGWPHLVFLVRDWGPAFDPFENSPEPDLTSSVERRPVGGLGVHLVRTVASHYCYGRGLGANTTELYFRKPA
jgi:anti-sigma regulatory factor (Ser/Thr protein kinase)